MENWGLGAHYCGKLLHFSEVSFSRSNQANVSLSVSMVVDSLKSRDCILFQDRRDVPCLQSDTRRERCVGKTRFEVA